jgi:hypothetical protein
MCRRRRRSWRRFLHDGCARGQSHGNRENGSKNDKFFHSVELFLQGQIGAGSSPDCISDENISARTDLLHGL